MAEYQLTATDTSILRTADKAWIPTVVGNRDYDEYLKWVEVGGVPDPYVEPPPPPPPPPTAEEVLMFDHENRLRVIEGTPPIVLGDFISLMRKPL